jgi:hypothetical protein
MELTQSLVVKKRTSLKGAPPRYVTTTTVPTRLQLLLRGDLASFILEASVRIVVSRIVFPYLCHGTRGQRNPDISSEPAPTPVD